MITRKASSKLIVWGFLLTLPFMGIGYAQGRGAGAGPCSYGPCMANSFDEALEQNDRLRSRYEGAGSEVQGQIRERWELRKEKRDSLTDAQKVAILERRQERRAYCDGSGMGKSGLRGRMGGGRRW
jgi:hypothetical protein